MVNKSFRSYCETRETPSIDSTYPWRNHFASSCLPIRTMQCRRRFESRCETRYATPTKGMNFYVNPCWGSGIAIGRITQLGNSNIVQPFQWVLSSLRLLLACNRKEHDFISENQMIFKLSSRLLSLHTRCVQRQWIGDDARSHAIHHSETLTLSAASWSNLASLTSFATFDVSPPSCCCSSSFSLAE